MEGRIEDRSHTVLAGLSFFGNPFARSAGWTEENEIGLLWDRFMQLREAAGVTLPKPLETDSMFEIHIPHGQTKETGEYEVFVGYPVEDLASMPVQLVAKVVPAGRFARFTLHGPTIVETDSYLKMYEWITRNGLRPAGDWACNLYDSRFKGLDRLEESAIDVCIPVLSIEDAG